MSWSSYLWLVVVITVPHSSIPYQPKVRLAAPVDIAMGVVLLGFRSMMSSSIRIGYPITAAYA